MSLGRSAAAVFVLFRLVLGLLFGLHGLSALFGVLGGVTGTGQLVPFGVWPHWWAALIQFVGGFLVLAGLGTRVSALVCSGSMAYAYFFVHQPLGLLPLNNGGEIAVLFCWSFLLIAAFGPGRFAADNLFSRRTAATRVGVPDKESDKELAGVG
jgi:putative oxidoreductase